MLENVVAQLFALDQDKRLPFTGRMDFLTDGACG
jgi:hypothetical protein